MTGPGIVLRPLRQSELDALVELCAEHADYERADYAPEGKRDALAGYLFGPDPRAHCLVAASGDELVGYATWSREFSTWKAAEYLHMDCLYVRSELRGRGIGKRLLRAIAETCLREGLSHMEWQSPRWNEGAIRFYRREGASSTEKLRFAHPGTAPSPTSAP